MTGRLSEMHIPRAMLITVLVPTYRRPEELSRCLAALRSQSRPPDQLLVTLRPDDAEAAHLVEGLLPLWPALRPVPVVRAGVVAAMNAALDATGGEILALTDDDAEPAGDWLARLECTFREPDVAGVGGRDDQPGAEGERETVGRLQWFGRVIGNHHLGAGPARDVDVLKGVNCAFRVAPLRAVRFDERLRGTGAQVHWELVLCLALRRAGWRLRYDPRIRVRHTVAPRHDADQLHRGHFDPAPHQDAVFNSTLARAEYLGGVRACAFRWWSLLVGTAEEPGLLQLPRLLLREGRAALPRWRATVRGRSEGLRAARRRGTIPLPPPPP